MVRQELRFESNGKEKFALLILTLITRHKIALMTNNFTEPNPSKHFALVVPPPSKTSCMSDLLSGKPGWKASHLTAFLEVTNHD